MMRQEARQAAIGHIITLFGLYAAASFLMPRYLVLFEGDLATRGTVANLAAEWSIRLGHLWTLVVPVVLVLGYLDYRASLVLRFRGMHALAAIWGMAVVGSVAIGFLWFCWALSVWHLIVWERLNPKMTVPQWASSGTLKAFILFAATFVSLVALGLLAGHRDRQADSDAAERQQTSDADPRTSGGTP
ncbi:MAG: hypothetical protein JXR77_11435 [Lentisphaeria bacterium]|nr:hypothetical protein [Lentisphaeria bacterium]